MPAILTGTSQKTRSDCEAVSNCSICNSVRAKARLLACRECKQHVHATCLGLGPNSYPAGTFTCADCVRFAAKLPADASEQAHEAAHRLVLLRGMRVRDSSQNTYASSLHRYIKFWVEICGKPISEVLPEGDVGVAKQAVHLFISWAAGKYKYNTILSTISALIDWHKSKGVAYEALRCRETKELLNTVQVQQGPSGVPVGKTGLTRAMLRLLLRHLHNSRQQDQRFSDLYLRDICWILLGYFGMLRRSEIIALQMQDVHVGQHMNKPYIELTIQRSKTDQRGAGAIVTIAGVSQDGIRIASLLQEWLRVRSKCKPSDADPLFTT